MSTTFVVALDFAYSAAASAAIASTMRSSRSGSGSAHTDGSASNARNSSSSACALVVEISDRFAGQIADALVVAAHWYTSIIGTSRRFIRFPIRLPEMAQACRQPAMRAKRPRLDGTDRYPELLGDLRMGESLEMVQLDELAFVRRQLVEGAS